MARPALLAVAALTSLAACAVPGTVPGCAPLAEPVTLPEGLEEASGVAVSRTHPGVYWTHGDGEDSILHAVDASGALTARVALPGGLLRDWEDLAIGACGPRDCLYISDSGNNEERGSALRIFRIPEPDPRADTVVEEIGAILYALPDGGRDIEALFVLPGERVYFVSKGRNHAVSVYRAPQPIDDAALITPGEPDPIVALVEVQRLSERARSIPRQVTGASASADGERVAIRTYETVTFYRMEADTLAPLPGATLNLRTLREPQGEGVGLGRDGLVALTSEAGPIGGRGSLALLRCELE